MTSRNSLNVPNEYQEHPSAAFPNVSGSSLEPPASTEQGSQHWPGFFSQNSIRNRLARRPSNETTVSPSSSLPPSTFSERPDDSLKPISVDDATSEAEPGTIEGIEYDNCSFLLPMYWKSNGYFKASTINDATLHHWVEFRPHWDNDGKASFKAFRVSTREDTAEEDSDSETSRRAPRPEDLEIIIV